MENMSIKDVVLEKKMSEYGFDKDNFLAQSELTVTITLHEYRDLVEKVATRDTAIKAAEKDKYARDSENEALKKEVATLKAELYEYQKRLDGNTEVQEDADL